MRILVAEDDETSRVVLEVILTKDGYDVVSAADGIAALAALEHSDAPSIAVLDLMMPGINGLEIMRRIRAKSSPLPPYLIMLSSRSEKTDVIAGLDAGADDYLTKPFDPGELRARIKVGRRMLEMRVALADKISELALALDQVRTLRGIVPICASCKNIRDDQGFWSRVETYVRDHTEAEFSHAVCPDCMTKLYPQFNADGERKR
jgi:sigma-B regulation protein RsbU (phosphoserine phosphatase)